MSARTVHSEFSREGPGSPAAAGGSAPAPVLEFAGRTIGRGRRAFVIAEAGVNHDGDPELALELVEAAASAGADAIKFQTFRAESVAAASAPKAAYQQERTGSGGSQLEMIRGLELGSEVFDRLARRCRQRGIVFLSTPADPASADLLEGLDVPAFKIASGEITNLPFLEDLARRGLPLILSTGMATLDEVAAAVAVIERAGDPPLALLQCVTDYPADPAEANLRAMDVMRDTFSVPVGYSDHCLGPEVAMAAVARGASIIEKHFTLGRHRKGPDHFASAEPAEFSAMVRCIRRVEIALGDGIKRPSPGERAHLPVARRSLHAARDIAAGDAITAEVLACLRPATGIAPGRLDEVVGRTASVPIPRGSPLTWDLLS